jgi:hypothetical protein
MKEEDRNTFKLLVGITVQKIPYTSLSVQRGNGKW